MLRIKIFPISEIFLHIQSTNANIETRLKTENWMVIFLATGHPYLLFLTEQLGRIHVKKKQPTYIIH